MSGQWEEERWDRVLASRRMTMRFAHGLAFIAGMILGLGIVTGELLDPTLLGAFACFGSGSFLVIHRAIR